MKNDFFYALEASEKGSTFPVEDLIDHLAFNEQGLVPVITQDEETLQVLMMAWMNKDAIVKTLNTGRMTYWSRSRQSFWIKGETSGHTQELKSLSIDCDGDALLCKVKQKGAACHTGRRDCFYFEVLPGEQLASVNQ